MEQNPQSLSSVPSSNPTTEVQAGSSVQRLGMYLRTEREKRGISLEQVAGSTKINLKILQALESDFFQELPAFPFTRGFIVSYAKQIGLDPKEVLLKFQDYLSKIYNTTVDPAQGQPHIFRESGPLADSSRTTLSVVLGAFGVAGFIIILFIRPALKKVRKTELPPVQQVDTHTGGPQSLPLPGPAAVVSQIPNVGALSEKPVLVTPSIQMPHDPVHSAQVSIVTPAPVPIPMIVSPPSSSKQSAPAIQSVSPPLPAAPAPATPAVVATTTPSPAALKSAALGAKYLLVVRAKEDSWVKYQADDKPVKAFLLKKDKMVYIRGQDNIRFLTGYPKGVEVSVNRGEFHPVTEAERQIYIPVESKAKFPNGMFPQAPESKPVN